MTLPRVKIGNDCLVHIQINGSVSKGLNHNEINTVIELLKRAQNDAEELRKLRKKEFSILKEYPEEGRGMKEVKNISEGSC